MQTPYDSMKNLEEILAAKGDAVSLLRNAPFGSYVFPVLPPEYSTWMTEQRAWRNESAFLDLSYHQTDLYIRGGQDALELFRKVALTKMRDFPAGRSKQLILASHDGYQISDGICFHHKQDVYRVAGEPSLSNWVHFNAITGDYDLEIERDETVSMRAGDPKIFIFQIQGPRALDLMNKVTNGSLPEIKFFHIGDFKIAGVPVQALRHGMTGEPGFEIFGPWEEHQKVRDAFDEYGPEFGMKKVGGLSYGTTALESAWLPLAVPAIYKDERMKAYREWITPFNLEVMGSLGGSFYSDDIEDYYFNPLEMGYSKLVDWDRDFIGRDALAKKAQGPIRSKVTLLWNKDDVADAIKSSLFDKPGDGAKFMKMPLIVYSTFQIDQVVSGSKSAGLSSWCGFSANAGTMISLALLDEEFSKPGAEVEVIWGDAHTTRQTVEPHKLRTIRATVAVAPYFRKTNMED